MKYAVLLLAVILTGGCAAAQEQETGIPPQRQIQAYRDLTPDEHRILVDQGTEAPFTGEYNDSYELGTYHCRRCDSPLFTSEAKFDSSSGWPAFDAQIPGSVSYKPDGFRTETVCTYCDAHLGHVFTGEGFTETDTRYCINSLALTFKPHASAVFAGGCFWCIEYRFSEFDGVVQAVSGYTGGTLADPSYEEVVAGGTGHVEAVKVYYDPEAVTYRDLAVHFFEIHDPTQTDGQGPDIGEQYLSVLFYSSEKERETAEELISILEEAGYEAATQLRPQVIFWKAEEDHQNFYRRHGLGPRRPVVRRFGTEE